MFCWCKNCKGPSKPKSRGKDTFVNCNVNCGMNATKPTAISTIDNDFPTSKSTTPTDYKASYDNDIHEPPSNEHAVNVSKGSYPDVGNKDGLPYWPKASKPKSRGKDTFVNCNVNHARNDVKPTPIATIDNAFPTSKRTTPTDYNDGLPNWPKASKPKSRGKDTFVNCNVNHARNAVKPTRIATIDNAFPTSICATPTDYNDGLYSSRWRLTLQIRPTGFPAQ
ncbi:uncharacterized protein [Littorina saxatilis]|uniref:uncharacterized protein n=1 Tax=Littorina saxatilis TaxID=31220 RepID=UPI0038B5B2E3